MIFLIFLPQLVKHLLKNQPADLEEDRLLLEQWHAETAAKIFQEVHVKSKVDVRHFNPNKLVKKEWLELGFTESVVNRILKYTRKGGQFREKEDLLKIYGINERLVSDYMEYILIPKPAKRAFPRVKPKPVYKPKEEKFIKVNLNTGDTTSLMSINGIGPYWSNRIVKYRELLGGFVSEKQVYEIYGMEESLGDLVLAYSNFKKGVVRQVNVNQDSVKILARHPYISYKDARAIIKYRSQHGDYQQIDQLKKIVSISDSVFIKMQPYLKVSE